MNLLKKCLLYLKDLVSDPHSYPEDPLEAVAREGDIPQVFALLRSRKEQMGGKDWQTAVRIACNAGQHELLDALLAESTDVTPENLIMATEQTRTDCVRVLLAHNINPNAPLANGTTALMVAAGMMSGIFYQGKDPIPVPAENEGEDEMDLSLGMKWVRSQMAASKSYASYVSHCCVENIELLLRQGADPNLVNGKGNTALIAAASCGNAEAVTLLIKAGADVKAYNRHGYTAWKVAAIKGHTEVTRILQEAVGGQ